MKLFLALFIWTFALSAWAQDGFNIRPAPDLSLAPGGVAIKNVPAVQSVVKTNEVFDHQSFDFVHGLLASPRLGPNLDCRISARAIKEERKFSTGTRLVEILEIELSTDHMGPRTLKFSFPVGSKLGRRIINNQDAGTVEEIKIVTPEPYENWFQFQHDGKRIVWAEIGSMYTFAPCLLKRN